MPTYAVRVNWIANVFVQIAPWVISAWTWLDDLGVFNPTLIGAVVGGSFALVGSLSAQLFASRSASKAERRSREFQLLQRHRQELITESSGLLKALQDFSVAKAAQEPNGELLGLAGSHLQRLDMWLPDDRELVASLRSIVWQLNKGMMPFKLALASSGSADAYAEARAHLMLSYRQAVASACLEIPDPERRPQLGVALSEMAEAATKDVLAAADKYRPGWRKLPDPFEHLHETVDDA